MIGPHLTDYTDQAQVTNWPARIGLVVIVLALIALALWGMRRGWVRRQERQGWIPAPSEEPPARASLSTPVEGLYLGTAIAGDWLDRVAVHDLGVRSRVRVSWGSEGVWLDRVGARSIFIPADRVVRMRLDSGVAGTVRAKDSVIVLTWHLGEATLDTGFRADDGHGHRTVLDGLGSALGVGLDSEETGEPRHA